MRRTGAAIATLLGAVVAASPAHAQPSRVYAGAGALISSRTSDPQCTAGSGCPLPIESGVALGIAAELGGFVTPTVSLGVELSVPARIETIQRTAIPNEQSDVEHRDLALTAIATFHAHRASAVRFGVSGGGGVVQEHALTRSTSGPFGSTTLPPYGPVSTLSRWVTDLVGGAELDVALGAHVSLVPELRVHILGGSTEDDPLRPLGLGSIAWRPAVALRAAF